MTIKLPEPRKITGTEVGYYYTENDLKQAIRDALEEAAITAWRHYMDTCKKKCLPAAEFGYWMACDEIRELKEQLK